MNERGLPHLEAPAKTAAQFIGVVVLLLSASRLDAAWRQYRSANFELYVDGGGTRAEEILHHLEQARSLFSLVEGSSFETDKPVRMIVFNSRHALSKLFGRGETPYAFYFQSRERNYMVFQNLNADLMYETAVHEYAHLRAREGGLTLPFWLSEGLAQFYSTMWPDGPNVRVGLAPYRVSAYGVNAFPSVKALLETRPRKSLSMERRRNIYIKGWALTRLLALGEDYRDQFADLLLSISAGENAKDAIYEIYGKTLDEVTTDLTSQLNAGSKPLLLFETSWDRKKNPLEARKLDIVEEALLKADLLRRSGMASDVRKQLDVVLAQDENDPRALAELGRIEQEDSEAVATFERAIENGAEDPYLYLDYSHALLRLPDETEKLVRKALEQSARLSPTEADPHIALAAYAEKDGNVAAQILHLRRARGMKSSGDYVRLIELSRALAANGSHVQARVAAVQAGLLARTDGQVEEVHETLGAEDSPLARVDALLANQRADEAVTLLLDLQKRHPGAAPIYERLAAAQDKRGAVEQAETFRRDALLHRRAGAAEARRDGPTILRWVALLDAAGLTTASDRYFEVLTRLYPQDWLFRNNRAYALANSELRLDLAVELAVEALRYVPEDLRASAQDTYGWTLVKSGRVDEAIEIFDQLSDQYPGNHVFRYHLGVALQKAGRGEEATEAFERVPRDKRIPDSLRQRVVRAREDRE